MSFRRYVANRRITNTPQGDFIADARADGSLPDAQSWSELGTYLTYKGADYRAVEAARLVWRGYRAKLRREARNA